MNYQHLLSVFSVSCLAYAIICFEGTKVIVDKYIFDTWLGKLFSCAFCMAFWMALFYFENPLDAAVAAVLATLINSYVNKL